jgi:hypothetical protein
MNANRIESALKNTVSAIKKTHESDSAINAIFDRVFPNGCPKEAGEMLGAYNMLSELLRNNELIRSDISNARSELISMIPSVEDDDFFSNI